jgi:hypothetical protein
MRPPGLTPRVIVLTLAFGMSISFGTRARAQHTPDPYNIVGEYNRQYEPYMYASGPNEEGVLPNQMRLEGRGLRSPNRVQRGLDDTESLDGVDTLAGRSGSTGGGSSRLDGRDRYRPNQKADKDFYEIRDERDRRYRDALRESDPAKRAKKIREFEAQDGKTGRGPASTKSKGTGAADRDRFASGSRMIDNTEESDEPEARRAPAPPSSRGPGAPPPPSGRAPGFGSSPRGLTDPKTGPRSTRSTRTPSDILRRSRELDRDSTSSGPVDPRTLTAPR